MPYIGNQPGTGVRNRFIYTATASQTTFSGADDNGKTLKYADSDFVDVFLNGVCLVPAVDYTSTTKTSVVLTQAASLNDTLEVIAYDIATIADTVSKADGGTFNGDLVINNSSPDITLTNNTTEDTDGGRESTVTFKGLQSGGEESTLAQIQASHDATADDQKGDLIFKTNDGSDGASPTERVRVDSSGSMGVGVVPSAWDTSTSGRTPIQVGFASISGRLDDLHSELSNNCYTVGTGSNPQWAGITRFAKTQIEMAGDGSIDFKQAPSVSQSTFDSSPNFSFTSRMLISSNGPIGTGVIAPNNVNNSIAFTSTGDGTHADHFYSFGPHYTSDDPAYYVINHSSVGVYLTYGGNSWLAHSDERIKENITSLGTVLPNIENLRCVKYNLKGQSETKIGFIAQDWEANFGEVVDEDSSRQVIESDGSVSFDDDSESTTKVKAMSYTETIPILLKAIQEQQEEIKTLKTKVAALEAG